MFCVCFVLVAPRFSSTSVQLSGDAPSTPWIVKFDYTEPPSTTTIAVYIYGRQDRNNKYPFGYAKVDYARRCDKYLYPRPRTSTKTCTTTVAVYHYAQVPLQDVPLPSPRTVKCTTSVAVDPTRSVYHYYPYDT